MNLQIDLQTKTRLTLCREGREYPGSVAVAFSARVVNGASAEDCGDFLPGLWRVACVCVVLAMGLDIAVAATPAIHKPTATTEQCATETCHAGIVSHEVKHEAVAQQECLECHTYAEPREHRFKSAFPKDQPCGNCHDLKHKAVVHPLVQEGQCMACHDPHGSAYKGMLVAAPRTLCLSCHKEVIPRQDEATSIPS
jgi:predicted CXXCH cytochrome family protein